MGTGAHLELDRATFQNNTSSTDGGAIHVASDGGITLTDSRLINNSTSGDGGGIFNDANVHLFRSTFHDNQAENGGGIYSTGSLELENCTVSGNFADNNGGGIFNGIVADVFHSTISYNFAANSPFTPGGRGGGVYNLAGASFNFQDTILYGNRHRQGISPVPDDCIGTLTTLHYNLVGTLTGCTLDHDQGLDLIGVNPLLGDLADNGGPTETHALGEGSPAIDAADPLGCADHSGGWLTTDQRGYPLPWDGNEDGTAVCDIGAYEVSLLLRFVFQPLTVK
jgi:predicted outer membrane repeat protein